LLYFEEVTALSDGMPQAKNGRTDASVLSPSSDANMQNISEHSNYSFDDQPTTLLRRHKYRRNEWPGRNAGQLRILGGRLAREA
jgi:hypothetical protein